MSEVKAKFKPVRKVCRTLPSKRSVSVYVDGGGSIGLQFVNIEGERTRCCLSEEAGDALLSCLETIKAGGGEDVKQKPEWVAIRHTLDVSTPNPVEEKK